MTRSSRRSRLIGAVLTTVLIASFSLTPATAQEPAPVPAEPGPEADLALALTMSNSTPLVGGATTAEIVISNGGPEVAKDVFVYGYLSDSMEASGLPTGCSSDGYGGFSCSFGELVAKGKKQLALKLTRVRAREAWVSFSVSSSNYDPFYENNYAEVYVGPDTSNPADIGVTVNASGDPEVGETFTYSIKVTNEGPRDARAVELRDSLPSGVDFRSWSSSDPTDECTLREEKPYVESSDGQPRSDYVYRELGCSLGTLAQGESAHIQLIVQRNDPYELWNSAWVMTASYDSNYENDYAYSTTAPDESVTSDLAVEVQGPSAAPLVGDSFNLVYTVGNEGPAPTSDAALYGFLPDGLEFVSASSQDEGIDCSANTMYGSGGEDGVARGEGSVEPAPSEPKTSEPTTGDASRSASPIYYGGGGFNCALGSLGAGDSATVTVSVTRSKARETWATASVWSMNYDRDYEDNYAETPIAADTSTPADVSVSMTGPDDAEVGEGVEFEVTVTNSGPMEARSVIVTDVLPYGLDYVSAAPADTADTCSVDQDSPYGATEGKAAASDASMWWGYRQVRCELGTLEAGKSDKVTLTATRTTEYEIWNSAYAETSSYDSNYDNDFGSVVLKGEPQPCGPSPLGTKESDHIAGYDCPVESRGGADSIVVQADSTSRKVDVSAGRGRDSVTLNVPSGSALARRIDVRTGPGADQVDLIVAPNATNATIVIHTGSGRDIVTIDAPVLREGLSILVVGGSEADTITPFAGATLSERSWVGGFRVRGGPGADLLTGAYADDHLWGGRGRDILDGGGGNDILEGGPGADTCRGGPGRDTTNC